jgi:hypothetical protein
MRATLDDSPVELGRLWDLYAEVSLPSGTSGTLWLEYDLPRRGLVAALALVSVLLFVGALGASARDRATRPVLDADLERQRLIGH